MPKPSSSGFERYILEGHNWDAEVRKLGNYWTCHLNVDYEWTPSSFKSMLEQGKKINFHELTPMIVEIEEIHLVPSFRRLLLNRGGFREIGTKYVNGNMVHVLART